MPEKKKLSKTREMLVNEYIKSLEQDQLPWIKDWGSKPPHNAITRTPYRLFNKVLLWYIQERNQYEDSRWCTIRQAESREWFVKKGEKSIPLEFYYYYNKRTHKSMTIEEFYKFVSDLRKEGIYDDEKTQELLKEYILTSSSFNVFNVQAQMEHRHYLKDGTEYVKATEYYQLLKEIKADKKASYEEKNQRYTELKERYELVTEEIPIEKIPTIEYKSNEIVDNIIKNMGVDYEEKGDRAYYSPSEDKITLPPMTTFHSEYGYYATKLHESCHATGHSSRLNRDIENRFGSQKYAIEELRAEIGSSFLMAELGLEADETHVNNHKAYIQSWISELKNDPKVLFDAIKDADEIVDYIKDIEDFEKYISLSEIEQETLDTIEEDLDELEMEM